MSTFNALNLTPQEEQLDAEEHSRELQIEESFKIFQRALMDLKAKKYETANENFEELLSMDVIKPNKWGFYTYSTPALNSLRYLAFRNRGMYYYNYLLDHEAELNKENIVDYTLKVVENLLESIQHGEADTAITALLNKIFGSYKSKRLQRWLLEYELTRQENTWVLLGRKRRGMLPQLKEILKQYDDVLNSIRVSCPIATLKPDSIRQYCDYDKINIPPLNSILTKVQEMKTHDEQSMKELDVFDILLNEKSWEAVANSIKGLTPHVRNSLLLTKSTDPYCEVDYPIETVKFDISEFDMNVSDGDENHEDNEKELSEKINIIHAVDAIQDDSNEPETNGKIQKYDNGVVAAKRPLDSTSNTRVAQRSSKRFKEKELEVEEDETPKILESFLIEFSTLLGTIPLEAPIKSIDSLTTSPESTDNEFQSYYDLLSCLKDWSSLQTDVFIQNDFAVGSNRPNSSGDIEVLQLNSLLKSNMFADITAMVSDVEQLKGQEVDSFIDLVNNGKLHFQNVRFKLLQSLLSLDETSLIRPIVDYSWTPNLLQTMEWILLGIEPGLYKLVSSNFHKYLYFALSIYEILVNRLGCIQEEIEAKRLHGNKTNELKSQRNHLDKKIIKWYSLLKKRDGIDEKWNIYLGWAHYCYLQYSCDIIDHRLLKSLHEIENKLNNQYDNLVICYPNYRHIPSLNAESLSSQIRKINIIRKISIVDASEDSQENEEMAQHIEMLQNVLLRSLNPQSECCLEYQEMFTFISKCPFMLKVKLWEVLLSFYVSKGDMENILRNYFNVLTLFTQVTSSEHYLSLSERARQQMLLIILSSVGNFTSKLINSLSNANWKITEPIKTTDLSVLTRVFFLFFPILYFESVTRNDHHSKKSFFKKAVKSSTKMKQTIADLATVVIFFFNSDMYTISSAKQDSFATNLIWSFHSLLGAFGFCDISEGNFLKVCERILCRIVNNDSLVLLKQVLWCKYHYSIAGDNFLPEQHPTKAVEMDKGNSLPLGIYLIKLLYQEKNPLLASGSKNNLKPVFDSIIETIGDPTDSDNFTIDRNKYILSEYLESPVTAHLFRNMLQGKYQLSLTTPDDELQESMDAGVFYVSSIQSLNLYRSRKKLMQARPSELDSIISMLKCDIVYNTRRFESWYLLGKCYAYIVEDDLMWTSDKLTVIEKKSSIALTQRRSILCYMMSLTLFYGKTNKLPEDEIIAQKALEELGIELISGYFKPMEKLCFTWKRSETLLALNEDGTVVEKKNINKPCMSDFNIEQAILLCFRSCEYFLNKYHNEENACNWITYYHTARMYFKIDHLNHFLDAFDNIQKSCQIALRCSAIKETIIEPHYTLVNMCFKSVKIGTLGPTAALIMLAKDHEFFKEQDDFWESDESLTIDYQVKVFYRKIIKLLQFLLASDKKKWHHRPRYRIARILFDEFDDVNGALSEMDIMMSIKSAHKNLVNIWKPDFERPGKHFVYTNQYVMFYLDMLYRKGDFNSIGLVCKKIRRFGSGMAYVNKASEHAVKLYTNCTRSKLNIDEKTYIEQILPSLNYQVFMKISQSLLDSYKEANFSDEILEALKIAYQLKRGNNGIAFDGICLSIYLKFFYLPFAQTSSPDLGQESTKSPERDEKSTTSERSDIEKSTISSSQPPSNNQKTAFPRKRVSKKDAFDKVRLLVDKIT